MSGYNDDAKLKLAWQTAFELRTCPDSKTIYATDLDENLKRHLAICHVCREKREMPQDERDAWTTLKEMFVTLAMKPGIGTEKQAGQVWTIKPEFGGWREDGRYIRPPSVMLLEKAEGTSGWRVAQLYSDVLLMGNGDVSLDDRYGFAEAWNCYTQKEDRFDKLLGGVKQEELKQVITASFTTFDPAPKGSILSFFRSMEIDVGAYVSVPAVLELVDEWEAVKEPVSVLEFCTKLFPFEAVRDAFARKGYEVKEALLDTFKLAASALVPPQYAPLAASGTVGKLKRINYVFNKGDSVDVTTLMAEITFQEWQDDGYFLSGKLSNPIENDTSLLAVLDCGDGGHYESQAPLSSGNTEFELFFEGAGSEQSRLDNVQFLLVGHAST